MDLKKEINPGDYVMYDDGLVVVDDTGNPLKVVKIDFSTFLPSVRYENGQFDWLYTAEKIPELIKELL